jgi:chemotaxis protein histidine kinase CheA/ActR/RegA family two-component response regulator
MAISHGLDVGPTGGAPPGSAGWGGGEGPPPPGYDANEARALHQFFREEALEHLEGINAALLALEKDRGRTALIDELLRKTHTLKGSAATVGLTTVSEAAHVLEDAFVRLRAGKLVDDDSLFDALMAATDTLRSLVDAALAPDAGRPLLARLRVLVDIVTPGTAATRSREDSEPSAPTPAPRRHETGPIVLHGILGGDPDASGESSGPHADEVDILGERRLAAIDRRAPDTTTLRVDVGRVDALMDGVGELVFDRTRIERRVQELRGVVRELTKTRAWLRATLGPLRSAAGDAAKGTPLATISQRAADLEGELGMHIAHLSRAAASLIDDTEALRRTTSSLQEGLTQVRMMSVRGLFQRLARPLRDIARREGKRVEMDVSGEETELDRTVVEKVTDPLIQLLRNAVAHGIEAAHERVARGKPPAGRISLTARHQGDSVFLEVADDGAGIDPARVRATLVMSRRITPAQAVAMSDERVIASIFEAGVSTREEADELAGRGVGLDVVRDAIARLGGEISVQSTPGEGTRFSLRLPLTMAVTQAFLFKVAGQVYAIPNVHVIETTYVEASSPAMPSHLRVREDPVPIVALHRVLGVEPPADARRVPAVVLEFAGRRLAATCDKVIGAREIVVKSLGPLLAPLGLYAGATISGNGKVQLILDPATLAQLAYPARAPTPEPIVPPGAGTTQDMPAIVVPARILVVDDSRVVRESLARMLAAEGHIVDAATDGAEAWDMLQDVRYDLLVTDVEMPRLGGLELLGRVRGAITSLARMPALVISSRASAPHRERAERAGASAFLPKPVTRQAIAQEIDKLLGRRPK